MASLFYFAWSGNKRSEIKHFIDYIKEANPSRVIEPFCGSCAVSLHSSIREGIKCDYILNDTDRGLLAVLNHAKANGCAELFQFCLDNRDLTKEEYKKLCKEAKTNPNAFNTTYYNKVHNRVPGLYPPPEKKIGLDFNKYTKTDAFFKDAVITQEDYKECMNKYKDDAEALLFLDPPYLDSSNSCYSQYTKNADGENIALDNTEMYVFILEFLKVCKCKIIMVMNGNALTHYIFRPWIKKEYTKLYQATKRKTTHFLITNFKRKKKI